MENLYQNRPVVDSLQKHVDQFEEARLIEKEQLLITLNIIFGAEVVAYYSGKERGSYISLFRSFREHSNLVEKAEQVRN